MCSSRWPIHTAYTFLCKNSVWKPVYRKMATVGSLSAQILDRERSGDVFCSLELSPPKCKGDLPALLRSADHLQQMINPLFWSTTCHWTHSTVSEVPAVRLAQAMGRQQKTMLHLAVASLTLADVKYILDEAKRAGITSVFALRGDEIYSGDEAAHFPFAVGLVKYIRDCYGDHFTICVAGYPLKHPQAVSYDADLAFLKQKVEAGADLIITQITFDASSFVKFVTDCRDIGIQVPILPGIMAIHSYSSLLRMANLCQFSLPGDMLEALEPIRDDDQAVTEYGVHRSVLMMKELFRLKTTPGFHISTLNREDFAINVCKRLGIWSQKPSKPLPQESQGGNEANNTTQFSKILQA